MCVRVRGGVVCVCWGEGLLSTQSLEEYLFFLFINLFSDIYNSNFKSGAMPTFVSTLNLFAF